MKKLYVLFAVLAVVTATSAETVTKDKSNENGMSVTVEDAGEQTVLYTIYRGHYAASGEAVGKLFALATQKGIRPKGPACYVYLNNPTNCASAHWLTEIRIPVDKDAMKLAGTLGDMTDIKTVPAQKIACIRKPAGTEDVSKLYNKLVEWVRQNGYYITDGFIEQFLSIAPTDSYSQMETKIMAPVLPAE